MVDPSPTESTQTRSGIVAPGPRGHWLLGVLREIQSEPLELYLKAWREYGDYVRLRAVPGVYFYLLTHPDAAEHVLQKHHKNYRKPDFFNKPVGLMVGNGILTSEGDFWLRQRRLAQPAFNRQHLARLSPLMTAAAEAFVTEHAVREPGQPFDMLDAMMRLSLRIASTTLLSTDISGDADEIGTAFRRSFEYISRRMNTPPFVPEWIPTRSRRQFVTSKRLLDSVVLSIIDSRRRSHEHPDDFLSLMLAAQDEETGTGMSDQQLKDEVLTLLTAGHDTMGAALSWAWMLLAQHPQSQQNLFDEVHGVLQGRSPTNDDLPNLPFTRAIFDETLRLYPPAWGQPRESIEADEINGYAIPKKSTVSVCQYITQRHPNFWSEPNEFRPERFLTPDPNRPKFAYFPFGGGPRVCIGNTFALIEGPLVLATIAQKFRVELVPNQHIALDPTFTLRPKPGVRVTMSPRTK